MRKTRFRIAASLVLVLALVLAILPASALAGGKSSGTTLTGLVKDQLGRPIAAASVKASQQDRKSGAWVVKASTSTDAAGRYTLALPSGTYRLDYSAANCSSYQVDRTLAAGTTTVDVTLVGSGRISGVVADASTAASITGCAVAMYAQVATGSYSPTPTVSTTTNSFGTFSANVTLGSYALRFSAAGYPVVWYSASNPNGVATISEATPIVIGTPGAVGSVVMRLVKSPPTTGVLGGRVTDANTGAGLYGASVTSYRVIGGNLTTVTASTITTFNGSFTFNLAPGDYVLRFSKTGYVAGYWTASGALVPDSASATLLTVVVGQTTTANAFMQPVPPAQGTIAGTVLGSAETTSAVPVSGCAVRAYRVIATGTIEATPTATATTDASGNYTMSVPGGAYVLLFAAADYAGGYFVNNMTVTQNPALATQNYVAPSGTLNVWVRLTHL